MRGSARAVLRGWRSLSKDSSHSCAYDTSGSTLYRAKNRLAHHQWTRTNALAQCLERLTEHIDGGSRYLEASNENIYSGIRSNNNHNAFDHRRFVSWSKHGQQQAERSTDRGGQGSNGSKAAVATQSDTRSATGREKGLNRQHGVDQEGSDWETVKEMIKYVRLDGSVRVRRRVMAAAGLLLGSKLLNVQVPFLFKYTGMH